jgi:hypothetical protein
MLRARTVRVLLLFTCLASSPSLAQNAGVGVGIGVGSGTATSNSSAQSGVATSTSSATGGQAGGGSSSLTINNSGQATGPDGVARSRTDGTLDTRVSGGTVSRQTGGLKNVPAVFAPGLAAAGLETCLGSVSGGGSFMGGGFSFGTTVPDRGCGARLDARTLWSMGLKKAAVARLCLTDEIQRSMPEVCAEYLPQQQSAYGAPVTTVAVGAPRLEPSPAVARGQPTMVIERATGRERACADFDGRRCLRWASR